MATSPPPGHPQHPEMQRRHWEQVAPSAVGGTTGPLEPPLCACGRFAVGRCLLCRDAACERHARPDDEHFLCGHCGRPEFLAGVRAAAAIRRDTERRENKERIARLEAERIARLEAERIAEAQKRAMTDRELVRFLGGGQIPADAALRDVTAGQLGRVMAATGREPVTNWRKGFLGGKKWYPVGWAVAIKSDDSDRYAKFTNGYLIVVTPDGELVRLNDGTGAGPRHTSDPLPSHARCPQEWLVWLRDHRLAEARFQDLGGRRGGKRRTGG